MRLSWKKVMNVQGLHSTDEAFAVAFSILIFSIMVMEALRGLQKRLWAATNVTKCLLSRKTVKV